MMGDLNGLMFKIDEWGMKLDQQGCKVHTYAPGSYIMTTYADQFIAFLL